MEINTEKDSVINPMVFIVRDKDGNPRFDDIHNVPEVVLKALTPSDLEYLNKLRSE